MHIPYSLWWVIALIGCHLAARTAVGSTMFNAVAGWCFTVLFTTVQFVDSRFWSPAGLDTVMFAAVDVLPLRIKQISMRGEMFDLLAASNNVFSPFCLLSTQYTINSRHLCGNHVVPNFAVPRRPQYLCANERYGVRDEAEKCLCD